MRFRKPAGGGRWPIRATAVTGLLALLALISMRMDTQPEADPSAQPAAAPNTARAPAAARDTVPRQRQTTPRTTTRRPVPQQAVIQVADPIRVRVPRVGINAPIEQLDVVNDTLSVPKGFGNAGWWKDGPEPGEVGPAVIAGHVDSRTGPAVFYRLRELHAGDQILVDRSDGTTGTFLITRMEQHSKNAFPSRAVYGDTANAQLRLVTCGGNFDKASRRYLDNIIAYAVLVG
jgi:sortase (surface protein transpeptidase)